MHVATLTDGQAAMVAQLHSRAPRTKGLLLGHLQAQCLLELHESFGREALCRRPCWRRDGDVGRRCRRHSAGNERILFIHCSDGFRGGRGLDAHLGTDDHGLCVVRAQANPINIAGLAIGSDAQADLVLAVRSIRIERVHPDGPPLVAPIAVGPVQLATLEVAVILLRIQALVPLAVDQDLEAVLTIFAHRHIEMKALTYWIPTHLVLRSLVPSAHDPVLANDAVEGYIACAELHPIQGREGTLCVHLQPHLEVLPPGTPNGPVLALSVLMRPTRSESCGRFGAVWVQALQLVAILEDLEAIQIQPAKLNC
mmetsp:Transcript_58866/g.126520  ORF Transcript_58866/g.126520 Transcript_58866/m.126520 type:complete len:311 (-) Transcript_58866:197-1129(-)